MLLRLCTFRPVALRSSVRLRCLPQLSTLADQAPPSEPKDGRGKAQRQGDDARAARKAAKKAAKAEKRAKREGTLASGSKDCDLCGQSKDMLIRCMTDESRAWRMVCTRCWRDVSGGVEDGDDDHINYKYGGIWKNKSASSTVQSAKKPKTGPTSTSSSSGSGSGGDASPP